MSRLKWDEAPTSIRFGDGMVMAHVAVGKDHTVTLYCETHIVSESEAALFNALGGLTKAAQDVLAERQRQVAVEGWTPEHDDEHPAGTMAAGGACYALWAASQGDNNAIWNSEFQKQARRLWPWDAEWWKPKDKRRNLIRAAALLLAEIERIDRAA